MNLRELKKEVHKLPNITENIQNFQDNWVRPIRTNTNKNLPFLQNLTEKDKKIINEKISTVQKHINEIKFSQIINEKLSLYSSYLIELKLTTLNGNKDKFNHITNRLLTDEFLNLKKTIIDIKSFDKNIKKIFRPYDKVNKLLQKKLSLDESVILMNSPHKKHLYNLNNVCKKQKYVIKKLGKQFISLVKDGTD